MNKLTSISGFPEYLPAQQRVLEYVVAVVKSIYQSHGFIPIETPAVELLSTLSAKGLVEREIYQVRRLHAEKDEEAELALHFDLTVPFARYVAQHFNDLNFPFKRYQLQKVWRGERPQKGRFREFYQFDVDIIGRDDLPLAADAEVLTVLEKAFRRLNLVRYELKVNNRKILLGFYRALGLSAEQAKAAIVAVDKLYKIGADGVSAELTGAVGTSPTLAKQIIDFANIKVQAGDAARIISASGYSEELFKQGCDELLTVFGLLPKEALTNVYLDFSMARGLDYYTGTIFELSLLEHPEFGAVCSGGRYDDLASQFTNKKLPGVGGSFGLSRFMDFAISNSVFDKLQLPLSVHALVTVLSEERRAHSNALAEKLRAAGLCVEVFLKAPKLGKQIDYAAQRGIPYVVFIDSDKNEIQVKDLRSKEQKSVSDILAWAKEVICERWEL